MKKILFLVISIIISGNITAQKLDWQERRKAADEIDVLIEKYINTCEFSKLGKSEYNTEQVEAFKALFEANAKITDRLSSQTAEDGGTEVTEQSTDAYTQALMARFPRGMTVKIAKLQADYSQLDQRKARVAIERQFRAKNEAGKYVLDTADVMLHLTIDRDLEFVKINKLNTEPPPSIQAPDDRPIAKEDLMKLDLKGGRKKVTLDLSKNDTKPRGSTFTYTITVPPKYGKVVVSDRGIATYTPNSLKTKYTSDEFKYKICNDKNQCNEATVSVQIRIIEDIPPDNLTGLYFNPSVAFGTATNNGDIMWGYETVRTPLTADVSANNGSSFSAGIEVDYYFFNNLGIGAGVQYQNVSGGFEVNNFNAQFVSNHYHAAVDNRNYDRIITMNGVTEEFTITNIGIPLLLKFRTHPEKKLGLFAHAGIQYNLVSSSKSSLNTDAMANYEAIRYSGGGNGASENTYNENGEEDEFTWFQTAASYSQDGADVEGHFNELYEDGHNIGINIPLGDGDNSTNLDPHLNILGRIGLVYNISQNMALQIGGQYTSGALKAGGSYQITDKIVGEGATKRGEYTSLLKGGASYSAIGLTAGLSMRLGRKK